MLVGATEEAALQIQKYFNAITERQWYTGPGRLHSTSRTTNSLSKYKHLNSSALENKKNISSNFADSKGKLVISDWEQVQGIFSEYMSTLGQALRKNIE